MNCATTNPQPFSIGAVFIFELGFLKQIRNAAHATGLIPIKTVLIRQLAIHSNWNYSHPDQLLLDYLY